MDENNKTAVVEQDYISPITSSPAYMNRMFCSTKERVAYIVKSSVANLTLGKYDTGSDIFLYKIFGLSPDARANAAIGLGIYDMVNDPLSALIIDKMRTRWGKFKPFQWLSLIPNLILGLATCLMPIIAEGQGMDAAQKLVFYMIISYISETVGAFFGGGGYIDNVFTPNPNERTSLLVSSKFISELFAKFPEQLMGVLFDLVNNGKIKLNLLNVFVGFKTFWWVIATIPSVWWIIVSKERVPQSSTPPPVLKGMLSVFRNRPMLIYMLSGFIGGIDIGTSESLYYDSVLKFNMMSTIAGIPGMPISYASYPWATKFRKKFSTKALWMMQSLSITASETIFFLTGLIGGKENGFYKKKVPMTIAAMIGNCIEMVFYGTKKIIDPEINFEVLDYCEWQNGYRVEATINLARSYIDKVKGIILTKINAVLLEKWAGFQSGLDAVQTNETMWRMFITACGPKLIFDLICVIPMMFYNIDKKTRERMYLDLEKARAATAAREKRLRDAEENEA
ncbi:MAG: MFS transporter [Clostridia bacterium]|nr:MFS transporter [Clostridia bacterium]